MLNHLMRQALVSARTYTFSRVIGESTNNGRGDAVSRWGDTIDATPRAAMATAGPAAPGPANAAEWALTPGTGLLTVTVHTERELDADERAQLKAWAEHRLMQADRTVNRPTGADTGASLDQAWADWDGDHPGHNDDMPGDMSNAQAIDTNQYSLGVDTAAGTF